MTSTAVELAPRHKHGLLLSNPVMTAAGTFGTGPEVRRWLPGGRLGAIVTSSITVRPRRGRALPAIVEAPAGVIAATGLPNPGIATVERKLASLWRSLDVPVIVSIAGESLPEFAALAARLDTLEGVAAIEINTVPIEDQGDWTIEAEADWVARVTEATVRSTSLPILVKLPPRIMGIGRLAAAAEAAGADAITAANALPALAIDVNSQRPHIFGGLSGAAIRPVSLAMVWETVSAVRVPVVGGGGITTADDALAFLMAGATAVQVGAASFRDPHAALHVAAGIATFLTSHGIPDVREIIGAARR